MGVKFFSWKYCICLVLCANPSRFTLLNFHVDWCCALGWKCCFNARLKQVFLEARSRSAARPVARSPLSERRENLSWAGKDMLQNEVSNISEFWEGNRAAANTRIGGQRVRTVRVRGGSLKFRALRLDYGNFAWGSEGVMPCDMKISVTIPTHISGVETK